MGFSHTCADGEQINNYVVIKLQVKYILQEVLNHNPLPKSIIFLSLISLFCSSAEFDLKEFFLAHYQVSVNSVNYTYENGYDKLIRDQILKDNVHTEKIPVGTKWCLLELH